MRWLTKKVYTLLVIVFIIVSIYFIITVLGSSKEIIEAYNRITYTKQEGTDNIRSNFLQVYGTYGEELFIALGIKKSDFAMTGVSDSQSHTPEENNIPFCTCTQKCLDEATTDDSCGVCSYDYTECLQELVCMCLGPDKCGLGHVDSSCRACVHDVTLCEVVQGETRPAPTPPTPKPKPQNPPSTPSPGGNNFTTPGPDGLGIIVQSTPSFDYYGNPNGGLSIKDAGCGILAAYFAYANNGGQKSFEETILEAFSDRVELRDGAIYNKPGNGFSMGLGTSDWNHYCSTLGVSTSGRVNGIPKEPGDYIFRYTYGTSGQHNIFVRVNADGSYQAACSANKSWQETISRNNFQAQYYIKVG